MGVHGEAAALTMRMGTSKEITTIMVNMLIEDKPYLHGDELAVIVNGCGQTTMMEQLLFFNDVETELKLKGINVFNPKIGSFITTQEMGGIALSFCKMDEDMKRCWSAYTDAPYFKA
jgi:dihydroxyacetone kinase-like protein